MAKQKKELTTKQLIRRNKLLQFGLKIAEYAVLPIPFGALMIVNRDTWFATTSSSIGLSVGAIATIGIFVAQLIIVIRESEQKSVPKGYAVTILKWIMICIIITCVEQFLKTIAGVMWIVTSGIASSFGLDLTRLAVKKRGDEYQEQYKAGKMQLGTEKARQEIIQEQEQEKTKIKIKIKK